MVNVNTRRDPAVYALHAGDHNYFYVGVTSVNSDNRLYEHIYRARSGHASPVYEKMRDLGIENVRVVDLSPITSGEIPKMVEAKWINKLFKSGYPLTNQSSLDGQPDSMSERSKELISIANRGRPTWIKGKKGETAGWTDERRAKMAERAAVSRANRIPNHGTVTEYRKYGCRCNDCTSATLHPKPRATEHGRYLYKRDKCRCDICVEANRVYSREWLAARRVNL